MESKIDIQVILPVSFTSSTVFTLDQLTEDDMADIVDDIYDLFDYYFQHHILSLSSPKCYMHLCQNVANMLLDEWEFAGLIYQEEEEEDDLLEFIETHLEIYHSFSGIPLRSLPTCETSLPLSSNAIQRLYAIPQPKQRTPEWYAIRNQMLSASNLWKVFSSESQVNSLIYEKCRPPTESTNHVHLESSMHWGVKYEPVSIMLYEMMYQSKVEEFGCIPHRDYPFLGASPDGIVTDSKSNRYGRMVEIKNIVNRDITGIPKEEYWIQTQIQMETCDLDECDFLETRFLEYNDAASFYADQVHDYKGVILHFIKPNVYDHGPIYKYMPLDVASDDATINEWIHQVKQECRKERLALLNTLYWYLEEMSCVLIKRQRAWFSAAIPQIQSVWETIVKERETGYEHRASKSNKAVRTTSFVTDDRIVVSTDTISTSRSIRNMPFGNSICLVKLEE
jgi:putative phage-type endonuclease